MNVRKLSLSVLGLAGLVAGAAHADAPATKWYDKVTLGGYVDDYYQQALTGDGVTVNNAAGNRAYDKTVNAFGGASGELTLATSDAASKTSYFVDIMLGQLGTNTALVGTVGTSIGQAYVTDTFGLAKFTLGKFGTIIGTEVTSPLSNDNFSRGQVYALEPTYSTGLKLDLSLPASLVLTGLIDNGNSIDTAGNEGKGYGLELAWSGIKNLTTSISYYGAPSVKTAEWNSSTGAASTGGGISYQDFINYLVAYQATDNLSFNGEYLYTTTIYSYTGTGAQNPKTNAYALYANWVTPLAGLSISPRFEQVLTPDNTNTGTSPYQTDSYTLTAKYADGPLTHYLELRSDASDLFQYSDGKAVPTYSQSQLTLTYAAAYGF
jgi:hypothetical protein